MELKVKRTDPVKHKTTCLVIGVCEGKTTAGLVRQVDRLLEGAVDRAVREREFRGKRKEVLLLHSARRLGADRVLLVGLGRDKGPREERLRQAAATAISALQGRKIAGFAFVLSSFVLRGVSFGETAAALAEGGLLASYRFDRYRTEGREDFPPDFKEGMMLVERLAQVREVEDGIRRAQTLCRGVFLARDLVNEPGNVKSPAYLAEQARAVAAEAGLSCTVLDRDALQKEGCGALLGVAQGSVREPCLIVLEYRGGPEASRPVALVGKGVVFDAGGISLKPAEKMDEMKMDMAGAAAVLGTLLVAAQLKLPVNLVGIVPAVENLPSGSAIRPGDILTSLSGRTIEVINTDAEGRLILADALTYAKRFQPRVVIDLATLTGACVIALGHFATAILANHEGLSRQLIKAGERSGERLWPLPLWDDYDGQIRSEVADVKNTGGRPAGTITAAAFLKKFADEFTWAHLDIAGTAWEDKGRPCLPKGGTGVGVRLLVDYLSSLGGEVVR